MGMSIMTTSNSAEKCQQLFPHGEREGRSIQEQYILAQILFLTFGINETASWSFSLYRPPGRDGTGLYGMWCCTRPTWLWLWGPILLCFLSVSISKRLNPNFTAVLHCSQIIHALKISKAFSVLTFSCSQLRHALYWWLCFWFKMFCCLPFSLRVDVASRVISVTV